MHSNLGRITLTISVSIDARLSLSLSLANTHTLALPLANILPQNTRPLSPPKDRADGYLEPLRLACQSRTPKLMVTALDCYQKLIAHGFLRGVARHTVRLRVLVCELSI